MKAPATSAFTLVLLVACAGHQPVASTAPAARMRPRPATSASGEGVVERAPATSPSPYAAVASEDLDEYHLRMLALAQTEFETFIRKAGTEPRFTDAVRRSRDHIEDIQRMREFIAAGLEERRKQ